MRFPQVIDIWLCPLSLSHTLATKMVDLLHLVKNSHKSMEIRNSSGLPLQHCNLRSGATIEFDPYKQFQNSRAKSLHVLARNIGFVNYFKIAQTCILCYFSTYCKQIRRKSNCLLATSLNVKTKRK